MSAALVQDKKAPHTFVDDLESILYVILWIILLYSPSSLDTPSLTAFIQMVLDPAEYEGTGGSCKKDFLIGHSVLQHLTFEGRPSLQPLLMDLATLFAVRYEPEPSARQNQVLASLKQFATLDPSMFDHPVLNYYNRLSYLKSHTHVIKLLIKHIEIESWPRNDSAEQQRLVVPETVGAKRPKTGFQLSDRPSKKVRVDSSDD
ncbi:hypothetical protein PILCRDRAFT_10935 [Piloderma croceum F 1598]|uniref:Fungal-type protein kinase domain-containing protein n=1 Tax=Piloderma croceum (strain F 1598) TaxID=765440 RepID=A0A0C3AXH4_PILCF|nr:hypothetical protein PILCRDRAFT_10935 [Piloderma croceum F 1598]